MAARRHHVRGQKWSCLHLFRAYSVQRCRSVSSRYMRSSLNLVAEAIKSFIQSAVSTKNLRRSRVRLTLCIAGGRAVSPSSPNTSVPNRRKANFEGDSDENQPACDPLTWRCAPPSSKPLWKKTVRASFGRSYSRTFAGTARGLRWVTGQTNGNMCSSLAEC
jgi:hypothetical protein